MTKTKAPLPTGLKTPRVNAGKILAKKLAQPKEEVLEPEVDEEPEMTDEDLENLEEEIELEEEELEPGMGDDSEVEDEEPKAPVKPQAQAKPKPQSKAVAPRATTAVATEAPPMEKSSVLKGDILIPRLLLMQGQSELVKARKAHQGDIVRSTNAERVAGIRQPGEPADTVEIIPLSMSTSWTVMTEEGNRWVRSEPRTAQNDGLPWKFEEEGEELKRLKTIDLIAILPDDIRKASGDVAVDDEGVPEDLDAAVLLPVAISFRSTGFTAGKAVSTFFAKVEALSKTHPKARPYHFKLPLTCFEDKNDNGSFFVFDVGGSTKTDKECLAAAAQWYEQVTSGQVKVQDEAAAEQTASGVTASMNRDTGKVSVQGHQKRRSEF